jgi:very-short-patch-repair endonuclease
MGALIFGIIFLLIVYSTARLLLAGNIRLDSVQSGPKKYRYLRRHYFMTARENACFQELMRTVGNQYYIFAQVSLATLVNEKGVRQNWKAARSRIDRKSVDFVLCDKVNISPLLAIELDDSTHGWSNRQARDQHVEEILSNVGLPLLRIWSTDNLAQKIAERLSTSAQN